MTRIRIAVAGIGNLGKACISEINKRNEFELVGVFSRRQSAVAYNIDEIFNFKNQIDVVLVCVGSRTDAAAVTPKLAEHFNTVDSFDFHARIKQYTELLAKMRGERCINIIGCGWDPGLFSVMRIYLDALIGSVRTFWGPGVSLGHTNALKKVKGVKDALQITVPVKKENRHKRLCYITADKSEHGRIEHEVKTMPHYFKPYETEIIFTNKIKHIQSHGGCVIACDDLARAEFKLKIKNNSRFTARIMLAYATALVKLHGESRFGVYTAADIAPRCLIDSVTELI